jgi:hypothetical protein
MRKVFLTALRATATAFSVADGGLVSIDIGAPDARTPAIPFLLLPAFSTATRAAYASKTTTCRGSPVLPGIRRTQGVPMACLIV